MCEESKASSYHEEFERRKRKLYQESFVAAEVASGRLDQAAYCRDSLGNTFVSDTDSSDEDVDELPFTGIKVAKGTPPLQEGQQPRLLLRPRLFGRL